MSAVMRCPTRYPDEITAKLAGLVGDPTRAYRCDRCDRWHNRPAVTSRQRRFERRLAARRSR